MADPMTLEQLTLLFRKLGAHDPERWARSQHTEGIPQLARFLFLRQAWRSVAKRGDHNWIDAQVTWARRRPNDPAAAAGPALERMMEKGVARDDVLDVVRVAQSEALHAFCLLLEDPALEEPEVAGVSWALFLLDEAGEPATTMNGLHESVLETEPTDPRCD